jgi:hypothetical protein
MESLNDNIVWEGNIKDVIAMFIHDSGKPLIDLMRDDGKASPSIAVKDVSANMRGKKNVINQEEYNILQY